VAHACAYLHAVMNALLSGNKLRKLNGGRELVPNHSVEPP
jgi:hypothetical protein